MPEGSETTPHSAGPLRPVIALLFMFLPGLLLTSCATIFKGPNSTLTVYAPQETQAFDTSGKRLDLRETETGVYELTLEASRSHPILFRHKQWQRRMHLAPSVDAGWVILDAFGGWPILVDGLTGNWNGFDNIALLPPHSLHPADSLSAAGRINDPALERLRRISSPGTPGFQKYLAATGGYVAGVAAPLALAALVEHDFYLLADPYILTALVITGPMGSALGIKAVSGNEHGTFGAAYTGALLGSFAASLGAGALLFLGDPAGLIAFIAAYTLGPPLVALHMYDNSRPRVEALSFKFSTSAVLDIHASSGDIYPGIPGLDLLPHPQKPGKIIPGLSLVRIRL